MSAPSNKRKASDVTGGLQESFEKIKKYFETVSERLGERNALTVSIRKEIDDLIRRNAFTLTDFDSRDDEDLTESSDSEQEEDSSDDEDYIVDESDRWGTMFRQLREYRLEYGDCKVPENFSENPKLGKWVSYQKTSYNNNLKTAKGIEKIQFERIFKLACLDFFSGKKHPVPEFWHWDEMFDSLYCFRQRMGNCNVPIDSSHLRLVIWVAFQRTEYKRFKKGRNTLLTLDRIRKLEGVGMKWNGQTL